MTDDTIEPHEGAWNQTRAARAPAVTAVERPEAAAEGTGHGEAVEACVSVQWKGTDVCLDFHCACGYDGHLDAGFAYGLECSACGRVYEMPHMFFIAPNEYGGVTQMPFPSKHKPSDEGVPQLGQPVNDWPPRDPVMTTAAYLAALHKCEAERDELRRKIDAIRALCDAAEQVAVHCISVTCRGECAKAAWKVDLEAIRTVLGGEA